MARIVRRPQAESDLVELYVRIGRGSVRAADRFLAAVDRACETLAQMPELGSRPESRRLARTGVRLWSIRGFKRYVIIYRPLDDGIEVLRVVHGARNLENLFES
jgi:toxin ParE1/3/4